MIRYVVKLSAASPLYMLVIFRDGAEVETRGPYQTATAAGRAALSLARCPEIPGEAARLELPANWS